MSPLLKHLEIELHNCKFITF